MRRTRSPVLSALPLLVSLAACGDAPTAPDTFDADATFDRFWTAFDRNYSYFEYKSIDWDAIGDAYRERARSAQSVEGMIPLLVEMVQPLRDVHVSFSGPGEFLPTWTPPHVINVDQQTWFRHVSANGWRQQNNWGSARFGDVGYIAIGSWSGGVDTLAIDAVLDEFRELPAIIIDVRSNGGGNSSIALRVAGRFTTQRLRYGAVRFRDGPRHSDFGPLIDTHVEPRGAWQYTRPVIVLSGRAVYSSNETFVAAMREMPHVTILGDTTGGSSGNPAEHALGEGWTVRVPRWIAYLVDGTVIEWNGVPPDRVIPTRSLAFGGETDPLIEEALRMLR